jgi:hypothetical protein
MLVSRAVMLPISQITLDPSNSNEEGSLSYEAARSNIAKGKQQKGLLSQPRTQKLPRKALSQTTLLNFPPLPNVIANPDSVK